MQCISLFHPSKYSAHVWFGFELMLMILKLIVAHTNCFNSVGIRMSRRQQQKLVLAALKAGKHVMLRDPVSTPLSEFEEQLKYSKKYGKFVQFSTMFVHQYRVRRFMDRVLQQDFGFINQIDANLQVNYHHLPKYGVQRALTPQEGSIRVLARFCVLVSTLFFNRVGSFAKSVQVHSIEKSEDGVVTKAVGTVLYTEVRQIAELW